MRGILAGQDRKLAQNINGIDITECHHQFAVLTLSASSTIVGDREVGGLCTPQQLDL